MSMTEGYLANDYGSQSDDPAAPAIDAFILRHLAEYAEIYVFAEEREAFLEWAHAELAADPGLANYSWPSLYHRFQDTDIGKACWQ